MSCVSRIGLWLACGATLTVASAWTCTLACPVFPACGMDEMALGVWEQRRNFVRATPDWDGSWGRTVPAHWPKPSYHYEFGNRGLSVNATLTYYAGCKTGWGQAIGIVRAGWPIRSMQWELVQDDVTPQAVLDGTWTSGVPLPRPEGFVATSIWSGGIPVPGSVEKYKGGWVHLPVKPVLAGFVGNSILFSAALWALFAGPGTIRRTLRCRAGRCAVCGYDLAGLSTCPECGRSGA